MKHLNITAAILFMVFATACDRSPKTNISENSISKSAMAQSVTAQSQSAETAPVSGENIPEAMPPYGPGKSPVAKATGMNPPHGQPGHRCDIAVGIPLDSPPGTGKSTPSVSSQLNATAQTTTTPSTAPGMNPPHGQPNHRCDIAVGVPLHSPAGMGKSTSPVVSGQNIPLNTAASQIPAATTPTATGMNPPHGQPNHRCDIGVGVPLDSPAGTGKTPSATGASPSTISPPIKIVPARE